MLFNYFRVALRYIARNRTFFVVSVCCLSIGITAALLIYMYVRHEFSFDRFHSKGHRIVRINTHFSENDVSRTSSRTPFPLKAILLQDFPEVESVARFGAIAQSRALLNYNGVVHYENLSFADPDFLQAFDFNLVKGDRASALSNPQSIILTTKASNKYFGAEDPMGKTIRFQNRLDLTVTGVVDKVPANSHIQFDVLVPIEFQRIDWRVAQNNFYDLEEDWLWNGSWTYVVLREGADPVEFGSKIARLPEKYYSDDTRRNYRYEVQPLGEVHFASVVSAAPTPATSIMQLTMVVIVGLMILVTAAINFTNLSIAQAPTRSKEVGLRKTMGAFRSHVVFQFLCEIFVSILIATMVAIALAQFLTPVFSNSIGTALTFDLDLKLLMWLGGGVAVVTLTAGIYPAVVISRASPILALKGILHKQPYSIYSLRGGLVILQLTISIVLISGIFIIQEQLDYLKGKDLGFDKSKIITIRNGNTFGAYEVMKEKLLGVAGIENVYRGYLPGAMGWNVAWTIEGKTDAVTMPVQMIEDNFVPMFGLSVVSGRDFVPGSPSDTAVALINEKMAQDMGWTNDNALGRKLSYIGGNDNKTLIELRVVGVIRNANLESLYKPIQPMVFRPSPWGDIAVKVSGNTAEMLKVIERTYKELAPGWPFEYNFLDSDIGSLYFKEEKLADTIRGFALLAVVISCSGLLALCSYVTRQRIKEVAIRKVHGASIMRITVLLGRYFITLAAISLLISIPAIYYFSNQWLSTFAFSVKPGVEFGVKTGLGLLVLMLSGISYHIIRVARSNAAVILNSE